MQRRLRQGVAIFLRKRGETGFIEFLHFDIRNWEGGVPVLGCRGALHLSGGTVSTQGEKIVFFSPGGRCAFVEVRQDDRVLPVLENAVREVPPSSLRGALLG